MAPALAFAGYVLVSTENRALPVEYTGSVAVRFRRSTPYQVRGHTFYFSRESAQTTAHLVQFLEENTRPGEPILVLGRPQGLYYLTDRINPIPAIQVSDSAIKAIGVDRMHQTALDSGLRYVIADRRFIPTRGRLWHSFLREHGRLKARDSSHAIWEIGS